MKCPKCHSKLREAAKFCSNCGKDLGGTKEKGILSKRWLRFTFIGACLFIIMVGIAYLITNNLSKSSIIDAVDDNADVNEVENEEFDELMDRFPIYEELVSKDEIQSFVDDFYEREDPDNTRTDLAHLRSYLAESIEEEYGERNLRAYDKGLFIDDNLSLEDKEQVLMRLRDEQEAQSIKIIADPVNHPQNELEQENRYRAIDELDSRDALISEDTFFVDTEGFIEDNTGGLNLGYPLFGTYFDESDEYFREVEFVVYHYVDEDVPLEAEAVVEFFEKTTDLDVQINGNHIYDYIMNDINEDMLDESFLKERIDYVKGRDDYNENYLLLKDSIYAFSIDVPLDIVVDVPPRQFPLDGDMRQMFEEQIKNESVIVTINGKDFIVDIAGSNVNETYINPEVR